jgi:hypothetical protein
MRARPVLFAFFIAALAVACGGSSTPSELADPDVAPHPTNAAGDAYPTANVGPKEGQIMPNLAFQGYPDSNTAAGLQNVSFADYYDKAGKDHSVLFVTIGATWCSSCASQTTVMESIKATYRAKGVVMLEVLVAGAAASYGPSKSELDAWVADHATTWTVGADVRGRRMFGQMGFGAVPSSMLIDTRTMLILDQKGGAPDDLGAYLQLGVDFVTKHPL